MAIRLHRTLLLFTALIHDHLRSVGASKHCRACSQDLNCIAAAARRSRSGRADPRSVRGLVPIQSLASSAAVCELHQLVSDSCRSPSLVISAQGRGAVDYTPDRTQAQPRTAGRRLAVGVFCIRPGTSSRSRSSRGNLTRSSGRKSCVSRATFRRGFMPARPSRLAR